MDKKTRLEPGGFHFRLSEVHRHDDMGVGIVSDGLDQRRCIVGVGIQRDGLLVDGFQDFTQETYVESNCQSFTFGVGIHVNVTFAGLFRHRGDPNGSGSLFTGTDIHPHHVVAVTSNDLRLFAGLEQFLLANDGVIFEGVGDDGVEIGEVAFDEL